MLLHGIKRSCDDESSHDSSNFRLNLSCVHVSNSTASSSLGPVAVVVFGAFLLCRNDQVIDKCIVFDKWDSLCQRITTHQYIAGGKPVFTFWHHLYHVALFKLAQAHHTLHCHILLHRRVNKDKGTYRSLLGCLRGRGWRRWWLWWGPEEEDAGESDIGHVYSEVAS